MYPRYKLYLQPGRSLLVVGWLGKVQSLAKYRLCTVLGMDSERVVETVEEKVANKLRAVSEDH